MQTSKCLASKFIEIIRFLGKMEFESDFRANWNLSASQSRRRTSRLTFWPPKRDKSRDGFARRRRTSRVTLKTPPAPDMSRDFENADAGHVA
jgi:hypothetical protein